MNIIHIFFTKSLCYFCIVLANSEGSSLVPIYAVDTSTLAIRTTNKTEWEETEPFFWSTDNCFPGLDTPIEDNSLDNINQSEEVLDFLEAEAEEEHFFPIPTGLNSWNIKCLSVWKGSDQLAYAIFHNDS